MPDLLTTLVVSAVSAVAGGAARGVAGEGAKWGLSQLPLFDFQANKKARETLVVVSVIKAGKLILMTKRNQNENGGNLEWCFPAAKISPGEVIIDRFQERYQEKFNIQAKPIKFVKRSYFRLESKYPLLYFHCNYEGGTLQNKDTQENEKVEWVDVNEVEKRPKTRIDDDLVKILNKIKKAKL